MIVIVDYGMGNIRSVLKACERVGEKAIVSSRPCDVLAAKKLILPGVGHFRQGMQNLKDRGLGTALEDAVVRREVPILGICLGMQLMTLSSEEGGSSEGLGWVGLRTVKFPSGELRVPHMGWNHLEDFKSPIGRGIDSDRQFYFVHSFMIQPCNGGGGQFAYTQYGERFISAFSCGNVHGVQFHPEKSHSQGLKLLSNFIEVD